MVLEPPTPTTAGRTAGPAVDALPALEPMLRRVATMVDAEVAAELADVTGEADLRAAVYPVTRQYAYLNHAAISSLSLPVERALTRFIHQMSVSGSLAIEAAFPLAASARARFARLIGVAAEDIAFAKNVSDALMIVAAGLDWEEGDNVVTAEPEFPSNVYPWLNLCEQGVEVRFAPAREGRVLVEDIAALVDERTRVVSLSHVEFGSGYRNDVAAVARVAHAAGALFGVDAIQSLGALRLDARACDIDFLAAGSTKWLLGPAHVGVLYVRPELLERLRVARRGWQSVKTPFDFFDYSQPLRDDAARLEGGSNAFTMLVGLDAALAVFEATGMEQVEARVLGLADQVRAGLQAHGHTVLSPDAPAERSGIVVFQPRPGAAGAPAADALAGLLAERGRVVVAARNGLVRVSPHYYNTTEDIERLLASLDDILKLA